MTKRPLCHRSEHQICNTQTKFSKMMLCIDHERAQQENTCKQIQEILSENFRVTHFPIRHNLRNIGRVLTQKKILDLIIDFDVFAIFLNDPGLDFNFYKKLKIKNPLLTVVYIEGDSEILFPTYSQLLIKHIDLFVSFDSLDAVDVVSQHGCRSICLGNLISQKDFYHIKNTKKKYDVLFYGGTKYKGSDREKILDFLKKKKIPIKLIGKSFGYISGCELNQKINQSRIVISLNKSGYNPRNIIFPKNYKIGMHLKSKIFEPMLCNTFVLCEKIENFDRFYKPKEELVSFTDKYDLIKKIKFYLNNPKIRERISKNAHFKTLDFFESKKQLRKMSNIIVKICNEKRGLKENFIYLDKKFKLKKIFEKGNYKPTKSAFVNYSAQIIHILLKKKNFYSAFLDLNAFIHGIPLIYIKNQFFYFFANIFVKFRDGLKRD